MEPIATTTIIAIVVIIIIIVAIVIVIVIFIIIITITIIVVVVIIIVVVVIIIVSSYFGEVDKRFGTQTLRSSALKDSKSSTTGQIGSQTQGKSAIYSKWTLQSRTSSAA